MWRCSKSLSAVKSRCLTLVIIADTISNWGTIRICIISNVANSRSLSYFVTIQKHNIPIHMRVVFKLHITSKEFLIDGLLTQKLQTPPINRLADKI